MSDDLHDFRKMEFASPDNVTPEWLEWFSEEFGREHFKLHMEPSKDAPFRLRGVNRALPNFSLYFGQSSPVHSRSVAPTEDDDPVIAVALRGQITLDVDGIGAALRPGTMIALRNGIAGDFKVLDDAEFLTIRLQHRLLEPLVPQLRDVKHTPMPADTPAIRLMLSYLRMLTQQGSIAAPDLKHLVTMHVHDLAAQVFGSIRGAQGLPDSGGVRAARLAVVKSDIISHLSEPNLSVGQIAARQGFSPRYIHMLFEHDGVTFSEYVIAQRLTRAYRMLADRVAGRTISAIAMEVGFGDLSYFNRTFRRRFGASPSELRDALLRGDG